MSEAHIAKVRSRGYWRVVIRPTAFIERRVANILNLKEILESSAVRLRGWDFPHVDTRTPPVISDDWMSQDVDWEIYVEYWLFYQSGQFLHLDGFKEDWRDQAQQLAIRDNWPPGDRLDVVSAVYRFTEIFEFAARLALTAAGDDAMKIEIGLNGLMDRRLWLNPERRVPFFPEQIATSDTFTFGREYGQAELAAEARSLAAEPAIELFRRFGWDPRAEVLREMQDQLRR